MASRRRWKLSDLELTTSGKLVAKSKAAPITLTRGYFQGRVLGIDPSLRGTGLAVIEVKGKQLKLLFSSTIKTKGEHTSSLGQIAQSLRHVCEQFRPDAAAIEETIFAQNQKTAITLGASRGAALGALALYSIEACGYAPTRIKQAVVGYGRASKEQVIKMTQRLLNLPAALPSDEADAAAAALCRIFSA